jgi:hypothetical protein
MLVKIAIENENNHQISLKLFIKHANHIKIAEKCSVRLKS